MTTTTLPAPPRRDAGAGTRDLVGQAARLAEIDGATLERMQAEALGAPSGVVAYGDYQSGGGWTVSRFNHSGDPMDTVVGDGRARATSLLAQMPATAAFLDGLGLDVMYVRLARLGPNSFLWPHRDYAELSDAPRHRLHVPLLTNPSAALVTHGARVHMAAGAMWRLTPTVEHGVCNTTGPDRLHLIADVYADDAYQRLAGNPHLLDGDAVSLPELSEADRAALLGKAGALADLGYAGAAEHLLLRTYFDHALPEGGAYDLIAEMSELRGDAAAAERWRADRDRLLARTADAR
jgi:hypothetical protein